mgnify:CR=1 FL=1
MGLDRFWWGLIVFAISSLAFIAYAELKDINLTIASLPFIGVILSCLFKLFRDDMEQQRKLQLQENEHKFHIGASSHMANIAFDKHIEFCEEYLREVDNLETILWQQGPTEKAIIHANNLWNLRKKYTAWITLEISQKLGPFEQKVRELGANQGYVEAMKGTEGNTDGKRDVLQELMNSFKEIINRSDEDHPNSVNMIREEIRDILQINKLTKIRTNIINTAFDNTK